MQLLRIRIHPIKSLAGIDVDTVGFTPAGSLRDDRRWCLVRQEAAEITPDSVYMTKVDKTEEASAIGRTRVQHGFSVGEMMSLELDGHRSPEFCLPADCEALADWCSERYEIPVRLEESTAQGFPDAAVYGSAEEFAAASGPTVVSAATLNYLSEQLALPAEELLLRFRTNLLVHDHGLEPFGEDELDEITLGDVRLEITGHVRRCPVPARDVTSGRYDRTFTRRLVEAKSATRIGKPLDRADLYTTSVYTRVITPDARLVVAS